MKVTVNGKRILMPTDSKISIVKKSPLFNDDSGTFSYPSPVATEPNRKALGFPDRLQRASRIPTQPFIIEEGGLQILTGILDYDRSSRKETGLIFKSGETDFASRAKGKKLSEIDFGTLPLWDEGSWWDEVNSVIADWDDFNAYGGQLDAAMAPCILSSGSELTETNKVDSSTGLLKVFSPESNGQVEDNKRYFMLQFRVRWLLVKMIEAFGFEIVTDEFDTLGNKYRDAVIFSNPFLILGKWAINPSTGEHLVSEVYPFGSLNLSDLMPKMNIIDFKEAIETAFCLQIDFDDRRKVANIYFVDQVYSELALTGRGLTELDGWENDVNPQNKGYALRYESQDNDADTEEDMQPTDTSSDLVLPAPTYEGQLIHWGTYDRYYVAELDDNDNLYWSRVGRLKGVVSGTEDLFEQTINAKIPEQVVGMGAEVPKLSLSVNSYQKSGGVIGELSELYLSVYRGMDQLGSLVFPLLCAEEYTLADASLSYPVVGYPDSNLLPKCLIDLHQSYLEFQADAIPVTKYFRADLLTVINLQFNRRYVINGVPIIFDQIRYDLPYKGTFKVEAFTA